MDMNTNNQISTQSPSKLDLRRQNGLGIRGKLMLGFLTIILFLIIAVGTILFITINSEKNANKVNDYELPTEDALIDLNTEIYDAQNAIQKILITHNLEFKTELDSALDNITQLQLKLD